MEDITERRAETKRVAMLKDDFVATVSHELRTPLTSIAGSLGLLALANGELSAPSARLMNIAVANSERLLRLINGILDIEKIESRNVAYDMHRIRVHPFVSECIESVRGFAAASGVQVILDGECMDCEVRADANRLAQVVTNLLSNAIKYSPSGKEVIVSVRRSTNTIRVSVRDHGPGIPDAFKPHVFEKFAQAENSDSRTKGGTGLGLCIAKEIVTQHGGTIGFSGAPGGGTSFHFELPDWAAVSESGNPEIDSRAEKNAA
jgi:signal transduction histidine kinase